MAVADEIRLEVADRIRSSSAEEGKLSTRAARSYVRCLQRSWDAEAIRWWARESESQVQEAYRLVHAASIFQRVDGQNSSDAAACYSRAAELLEWLSRSDDAIRNTYPIDLVCASAYQLGRQPAMAASFFNQVEARSAGEKLIADFLKGDFYGVLSRVSDFWLENYQLVLPPQDLDAGVGHYDGDISWVLVTDIVRVLGLFCDSLRRGDFERTGLAVQSLQQIDQRFLRVADEYTSLLVNLISRTAESFVQSNIFSAVHPLAHNNRHASRLQLFSKKQFSLGRGILWPSQKSGIDRLVSSSSFALCTPTGSGKTLIAILVLIKELLLRDAEGDPPICLYIVPSRALATEVEQKLGAELGQDLSVTSLYGGADWDVTSFWMTMDKPTVLVSTVEKAEALIRNIGPLLVSRIAALILDEAHQILLEDNKYSRNDLASHNSRQIRLESLITRLIALFPNAPRVALTAVAGGAERSIAEWVAQSPEALPAGSKYRSTRQVVGLFRTAPRSAGMMRLDLVNGAPLTVQEKNEPIFIPLGSPPMPLLPASLRNSIYCFNELSVLWASIHLARSGRRILISLAQNPEKTMRWYVTALQIESWREAVEFEPPAGISREFYDRAVNICDDLCGAESYESFLLRRGIATSHGQMPLRLRSAMGVVIESGICPITVATATLTEGVNLPFDMIFVTSLKRTMFDQEEERQQESPLSIAEFSNLAGRAGRPGTANSTEGVTLVAVPRTPSSTARATIRTQRRQIRNLHSDYQNLMNRLQAASELNSSVSPLELLVRSIADSADQVLGLETEEEFLNWLEAVSTQELVEGVLDSNASESSRLIGSLDELDSFLLNAIEEVSVVRELAGEEQNLESSLGDIWRSTFAKVAASTEIWLEKSFVRRGKGLVESFYPEREERRKLYRYGYSPLVGRQFDQASNQLVEILEATEGYGTWAEQERIEPFYAIGELLLENPNYGFQVRDTVSDQNILNNWSEVLRWWMKVEGQPGPDSDQLRSWQRFQTENLEYRMGSAIGAIVSAKWDERIPDPFEQISLEHWKERSGLSWFSFWARELLRYGTLDPCVAFIISQKLADTREGAMNLKVEFETWFENSFEEFQIDDQINPSVLQMWAGEFRGELEPVAQVADIQFAVELTGTDGRHASYAVVPVPVDEHISWLDPAGYELARSTGAADSLPSGTVYAEYELVQIQDEFFARQAYP